jgi:hypothetical protein
MQYHMTNKFWMAPDGERVLVPKDEVQGLMTSAFQSRDFHLGWKLVMKTSKV